MRALPVPGAGALSRAALRTRIVRLTLAAALVLLVLLVSLALRHPATREPSSLPAHSGDMVVLDLSASISSDTFSRIGETLRKLVATGGRYGLVVFSNVAYEALPPGSPSSALRPLIRYFTLPPREGPGAGGALPTNPWTLSFSSGTRISSGLDLAHRILLSDHLPRAHVVLISDLADDPADLQRLNEVASNEYGRGRTRLSVVALNAAPADEAFFARISGTAVAQASPAPQKPSPPPAIPPSRLPVVVVVAILAGLLALAAFGIWSARLRWSSS
jgi:hypothetical protein